MYGFYYGRLFKVELLCAILYLNFVFMYGFLANFFPFFITLKIWMSAPMEPTCAAHMLTARTRWALTAACVRRVTLGMASLVQVSSGEQRILSSGTMQPKLVCDPVHKTSF